MKFYIWAYLFIARFVHTTRVLLGLAASIEVGCAKANGREPTSYLGRVFNFKLGLFVMHAIAWYIEAHPSLELKTQPRFRPVSLNLPNSRTAFVQ